MAASEVVRSRLRVTWTMKWFCVNPGCKAQGIRVERKFRWWFG